MRTIGKGEFDRQAQALAIDDVGRLYVTTGSIVRVYDPDGDFIAEWGEPGTGPGQFSGPGGIVVDGDDAYAADFDGHRVEKFKLLPPLTP